MATRPACDSSPNASPSSPPKAETHSNPSVLALSTSVWGGNELSLEPQSNDTKLIYQVRIVARPPRPK